MEVRPIAHTQAGEQRSFEHGGASAGHDVEDVVRPAPVDLLVNHEVLASGGHPDEMSRPTFTLERFPHSRNVVNDAEIPTRVQHNETGRVDLFELARSFLHPLEHSLALVLVFTHESSHPELHAGLVTEPEANSERTCAPRWKFSGNRSVAACSRARPLRLRARVPEPPRHPGTRAPT